MNLLRIKRQPLTNGQYLGTSSVDYNQPHLAVTQSSSACGKCFLRCPCYTCYMVRQGLKESMLWQLLETRADVASMVFPRQSMADCSTHVIYSVKLPTS